MASVGAFSESGEDGGGMPIGLAADPRSGFSAALGTIGRDPAGKEYLKVGTGDSDWVLLEGWKYVAAAAPATTVSFTGLDGDKDVSYEIIVAVKFNSASAAIDMRPNSLTTNRRRTSIFSATGVTVGAATGTDWSFIDTQIAGTHSLLRALFFARRGAGGRSVVSQGMEAIGGTTVALTNQSGIWNEDTVNLTGIDFVSSVANGIGTGSMFMLRPMGLSR